MKAQCKHIYQSSNINKKHQAVLPSLREQQCFLLLLWQQDKVPFQLEQYLATYLPTPAFLCHLSRNPGTDGASNPQYAHINAHQLHLHTKWWKYAVIFVYLFSFWSCFHEGKAAGNYTLVWEKKDVSLHFAWEALCCSLHLGWCHSCCACQLSPPHTKTCAYVYA